MPAPASFVPIPVTMAITSRPSKVPLRPGPPPTSAFCSREPLGERAQLHGHGADEGDRSGGVGQGHGYLVGSMATLMAPLCSWSAMAKNASCHSVSPKVWVRSPVRSMRPLAARSR